MNAFTAKNEPAFFDAREAMGVEPNAMTEPDKRGLK
jgi:hypothetical protein